MPDRPRVRPPRRRWPSLATPMVIGLGAGVTTTIALGSWLMLTDPAVAADVAAAGDLMPLMHAIVDRLRSALVDWLAYL